MKGEVGGWEGRRLTPTRVNEEDVGFHEEFLAGHAPEAELAVVLGVLFGRGGVVVVLVFWGA